MFLEALKMFTDFCFFHFEASINNYCTALMFELYGSVEMNNKQPRMQNFWKLCCRYMKISP